MVPCPSCGCHVVSDDCSCPHCGSKLCVRRPGVRTAAAALLGLSMVGCPPVGGTNADYGVTSTDTLDVPADTDTDTDVDSDTDTDTDQTGDTGP